MLTSVDLEKKKRVFKLCKLTLIKLVQTSPQWRYKNVLGKLEHIVSAFTELLPSACAWLCCLWCSAPLMLQLFSCVEWNRNGRSGGKNLFKGVVHPTMEILSSSFTHPYVIPDLYDFLLLFNTNKIFWRMLNDQTVLVTLWLPLYEKVWGISQISTFMFHRRKTSHTIIWEWVTEFPFLGELSLSV